MVRLRSSDTSLPGFRRRRRGRGFSYEDELGAPLADPAALERIRQLAIPPAWRNVWIAPWANGHIQAFGVDAAGRRQYLYHRAWRERRDAEKFERMLEFATALPAARAVVQRQIVAADLGRERVLACAFRLLDRGFFRIGGETYAEENQTFGLATLRSSHVRLVGTDGIRFDFAAKGGLRRTQLLVDPDAASVVRALRSRRGGGELLAYRDRTGWTDVRSADVNDYLRELVGCPCSAKDFRTWHATVLAAVSIAIGGGLATSERARNRAIVRATDEVAHYLGNTRAVCRASYIDPRVFEAYRGGRTIAGALGGVVELETDGEPMLESAERAVVELIGAPVPVRSRRRAGATMGRGRRPPVASSSPAR